jgi:hypothetical protein
MVAFLSSRGAGGGASAAAAVPAGTGERPRGRVYVVPAFSGEAEALTGAQEGVSAFAWSPGSGRIAYLAQVPLSDDEETDRAVPHPGQNETRNRVSRKHIGAAHP